MTTTTRADLRVSAALGRDNSLSSSVRELNVSVPGHWLRDDDDDDAADAACSRM